MTVLALLISEQAQLHVLAVTEAHRLAALAPAERLPERIATARVAPLRRPLFIIGALVAPWLVWTLISLFLFIAAVLARGRASLAAAWVAALNTYAVYGVGGVVNALLVAAHDPATMNRSSDLLRLPSPGWLFPHAPHVAAFLSAYNVAGIWYYVVVAIALEVLLRMPRIAAAIAAFVYSLFFGVFAVLATTGGP